MKKIYIVAFFILVIGATLSSCKKQLNQLPDSRLLDKDAITDFQTMQAATLGVYNDMLSVTWYGRAYPSLLELRGSNMYIASRNSNRYLSSYQYNYTVNDGDVAGIWNTLYETISRANNVINRSVNVADGDPTEKKRLIAEAKFIRAFAYFDLTRVFGQPYYVSNGASLSVPVVLDVKIGQPKRNTVAEVYAQVIKDLTEAKPDLPGTGDKFRASTYAASALLARVYLYKGDAASNALAAAEATNVISNSGSVLTSASSYTSAIFWGTPGQNEEIFTIKISQFQDQGSENYGSMYAQELGGYGDIRINTAFLATYDNNDVRKTQVSKVDASSGGTITTKFYKQDNIPGLYSPKVLRLAEMYFIRAEANTKAGTATGDTPANDLSAIRAVRGLGPFVGVPVLTDILREKNFEFAFEGHQWPDNFRNGIATPRPRPAGSVSMLGSDNLTVADNKQLFPIPQREVDANPNIKPNNPGYILP